MNPAAVRRNQLVFREVNNRIAEVTADYREPGAVFLCERGRDDCVEKIALDLSEYRELRVDPRLFLVASGHAVEGVDELVAACDGYDVTAFSENR